MIFPGLIRIVILNAILLVLLPRKRGRCLAEFERMLLGSQVIVFQSVRLRVDPPEFVATLLLCAEIPNLLMGYGVLRGYDTYVQTEDVLGLLAAYGHRKRVYTETTGSWWT
jgi:hypothetical protein